MSLGKEGKNSSEDFEIKCLELDWSEVFWIVVEFLNYMRKSQFKKG